LVVVAAKKPGLERARAERGLATLLIRRAHSHARAPHKSHAPHLELY
jgi:hypothetical protein